MRNFLKKNFVAKGSCQKEHSNYKGNTAVNQVRVWMSAWWWHFQIRFSTKNSIDQNLDVSLPFFHQLNYLKYMSGCIASYILKNIIICETFCSWCRTNLADKNLYRPRTV